MSGRDGGQAFPTSTRDSHGVRWRDGMTLRDYFAGQALLSLRSGYNRDQMGVQAYEIADHMLAARKLPQ